MRALTPGFPWLRRLSLKDSSGLGCRPAFRNSGPGDYCRNADLSSSILSIRRASDLPIGGFQSPKGNGMAGEPSLTDKGLESLRQIETCMVGKRDRIV